MGGADTNGAIVPVVVPDTQCPFNVVVVAGGAPGIVGGHGCRLLEGQGGEGDEMELGNEVQLCSYFEKLCSGDF